jgi:hypothetical protein
MKRRKGKIVSVDRSLVAVPRGKLARYQRRRRIVRDVGKGLLYVAGVGAIVALLANIDDLKNSKEAKDHWWLVPLGILVIGYMLRKRGNPYATAVLSAGGALFALAYAATSAQAKPAAQQPQQVPPLPAPKPLKKGETGSPFGANAIPAMGQMPDGGMWVQAPDGQVIRVPRQQLGPVNQFVHRMMQLPEFQKAA